MPTVTRIGDFEVLVVTDGMLSVPPKVYFPATEPEQWEPHRRWMNHDGTITFAFASFVVRSGGKTILIDAGIGDRQVGPMKGGLLLTELAKAGVQPADIDAVFCTHLHYDHYGHIVAGEPGGLSLSFPNASLHWTSAEQTWAETAAGPDVELRKEMLGLIADRYVASDGGWSLAPGVDVVALPGHTPGHAGIVLSSGSQRAYILGDAVACPVQLTETEWSGLGDVDPALARQTQEVVAREFEDGESFVGAAHFPGLQFGRVVVTDGRRYWNPV